MKVSAEWESKAKSALQAGDTELAKKALAKKVKADEDVANYKEMYDTISTQTEAIENQVEAVKAKLDEAKSRQAMLIARSQMADTKKNLAQSLGGMDSSSSSEKFEPKQYVLCDSGASLNTSSPFSFFPTIKSKSVTFLSVDIENISAIHTF